MTYHVMQCHGSKRELRECTVAHTDTKAAMLHPQVQLLQEQLQQEPHMLSEVPEPEPHGRQLDWLHNMLLWHGRNCRLRA